MRHLRSMKLRSEIRRTIEKRKGEQLGTNVGRMEPVSKISKEMAFQRKTRTPRKIRE